MSSVNNIFFTINSQSLFKNWSLNWSINPTNHRPGFFFTVIMLSIFSFPYHFLKKKPAVYFQYHQKRFQSHPKLSCASFFLTSVLILTNMCEKELHSADNLMEHLLFSKFSLFALPSIVRSKTISVP